MSSSTSSESTTSNTLGRSGGNSNDDDGDVLHFSADEVQQARALLKEKGFDPDDVRKKKGIWTPMIYFVQQRNLKMCRYLLFCGADCRITDIMGQSPMLIAAKRGYLDVVQFLHHDGGVDIRQQNMFGESALSRALFYSWEYNKDVVQWLILNGALAPPRDAAATDGDVIDDITMRNSLHPPGWDPLAIDWAEDNRLAILSWAQDAVTNHDNVQVFLTGTIIPSASFRRHLKNEYATRSKRTKVSPSSPLEMLKGKSGILELISNYVGTPKPQELRIFRQLMRLLPIFIKDVPEEGLDY